MCAAVTNRVDSRYEIERNSIDCYAVKEFWTFKQSNNAASNEYFERLSLDSYHT